jgi:hypothetical protein
MSTITITNQDYVETQEFTYGNCGFSRVYLNGLQEGEVVYSEDPFMIQNTNGVIAGLDQRFTELKVIKNNTILDSIELKWNDSCVAKTGMSLLSVSPPKPKTMIDVFGIQTILMIVSLGFAFFIYKIRK